MNNYLHKGERLTVTAPYAVSSGGGVKVGNVFGVASYDAVQNDSLEIAPNGVFSLAKDASVFAQGDLAYWNDTAKQVTSTVGSNLLIGLVEVAALTGDTTVAVKLTGVPGFSGQVNGVKVAHAVIDFSSDSGTVAAHTPANSDSIPKDAVVFGGVINVPTAVDSAAHGASLVIGTSAGSAANSIKTVTAQATLSIDAVVVPTCTATPFKMSAAGQINYTPSGEAITSGKVEVWVLYALASYD
ncbi:MAG: DUF2190 family protein [Bryobacteraceae bacterium]|jgi:predicted RecA/RadA family phage recombinase